MERWVWMFLYGLVIGVAVTLVFCPALVVILGQ